MSIKRKHRRKNEPKSTRPVGRPKVELNVAQIQRMAAVGLTQDEVATIFGVSVSTIAERPEFSEAHKRGRANLSESIKREQVKQAFYKGKNPAIISMKKTMLIWLGKQYCDQKERQEIGGPDGKSLFVLMDK